MVQESGWALTFANQTSADDFSGMNNGNLEI